ncbi:TIGR01777 family oxidoreductase [Pseudoalteromonas phenolica]|uniref:TIGR01777 family oxidoreductase n=1 Tax=Pseudoalteromonas phenolica TaxID=161398 RepID=UPI00110B2176|nr:TIGR01777 family oxidoreductase [Pseudoalteromonas phenolica]TMO54198.1 TIGR01777 family protein [Pseudoalteromonas phenolica]
MKILITGATGLIGSALCKLLFETHELVVLTRDINKSKNLLPSSVAAIDNLEDINFDDLDAVINLAGEPIADKRWSAQQKQKIFQSRLSITEEIVKKINASDDPPKVFISGSAIGFYGRQPAENVITESYSSTYPEFSHQLCKQWEELALQAQCPDVRVCLLRTGIVLSNQGGALNKMLPPFKLGLGGRMASGKQMMSWIHIDDMVNAILFLLEDQESQGAFNLTAPEPVSNSAFTDILAKTLKRPALFPMPEFVLKLLFGEMSDLLIYGQNVIPEKLEQQGFAFKHRNLNTALNDILN